MKDNLLDVTNSIKTSLSSLKRKTASLKSSLVSIETDIDRLDLKLDKLSSEADLFKTRVFKGAAKEIKELQTQIEELEDALSSGKAEKILSSGTGTDGINMARASTVAIIESILGQISWKADDFKTISHAFIFPAIYEWLPTETSPEFLLDTMPSSAQLVVNRGIKFLTSLREVCDTHLTTEESWDSLSEEVAEWWKGEGLPLIFGQFNELWGEVKPYSLQVMSRWKDNISDRVVDFPGVFDSFENYRTLKDEVYGPSGVKDFELKQFSFVNSK